jgi:hypothetical protein
VPDDISITKSQGGDNFHNNKNIGSNSFFNNINIQEQEESLEVGYFYMLNCDIKATEDMIRVKYLERTQEIIKNHYDLKHKIQM